MKSYKELEVWQKAVALTVDLYQMTRSFPPQEQYGLTTQIRRAAVSVAANIAEGWGRGSTREYIHFLRIARGSLMELETHLIISHHLGYLQETQLQTLQKQIESVGMMLNRLLGSIGSKL